MSAPHIYTIAQVDTALSLKANQSTTYTKTEVQQLFLNLLDIAPASLYTLNELANALANDANSATTIQNQLALKPNQSSTYTKTEVDSLVSPKSDKTNVDGKLALKANQLTT